MKPINVLDPAKLWELWKNYLDTFPFVKAWMETADANYHQFIDWYEKQSKLAASSS